MKSSNGFEFVNPSTVPKKTINDLYNERSTFLDNIMQNDITTTKFEKKSTGDLGYSLINLRNYGYPETKLSNNFFNKKNLNRVHSLLLTHVKNNTGYRIGKQNLNNILSAMLSIYIRFIPYLSKNVNYEKNIAILNKKSIDVLGPMVVTNLKFHIGYLKSLKSKKEIQPRFGDDKTNYNTRGLYDVDLPRNNPKNITLDTGLGYF